jgi:hypothetical protein
MVKFTTFGERQLSLRSVAVSGHSSAPSHTKGGACQRREISGAVRAFLNAEHLQLFEFQIQVTKSNEK